MAEALICAVTVAATTNGGYAPERGDIIDLRPDGHNWGAKEGPPVFERLTVPDSMLSDANQYTSNLDEQPHKFIATSARKRRRMLRLALRQRPRNPIKWRRWAIDLDNSNRLIDRGR